jgi:AsmA protein
MKRLIKFLLALVGIVVVVLIAAVVVAVLVIDPNEYKGQIAAAVHKATGRELAIQGDLYLSFFPWLGVRAGAMSLSNAPGFGTEPFAKIDGAAVRVRLLPLLRRDVEVDTVTLDGLTLHLIRNQKGITNWSDLTAQHQETAPRGQSAPPSRTPGSSLSAFAIGGVQVRNATVDWDDRQKKVHYLLSNLALHTGPLSLGTPVKVNLESDVSSSAPPLTAHVTLATEARYDAAAQHARLQHLKLTVRTKLKNLPAQEVNLTVTGDAELDLAAQRYRVEGLHAVTQLQGPKLPGKQIEATLDAQAAADLGQQTLDVTGLKISAFNFSATGELHGSGLLKAPHFTGTLTVPDFNARQLIAKLGLPLNTADPKVLTATGAALSYSASADAVDFTQVKLHLDQTHLGGSAAVKDFAHPAYRFQLRVDELNADRYLPPPAQQKTEPVSPATAGAAAAKLPLKTLHALDLDGTLSLAKFTIARLTMSDIKAKVTAKSGVIHAAPLSAKLYGGSYSGSLLLDARGKAPQVTANENLEDVDIGALGRDLLNKDLVAGTGSVHMKLSGTGADPQSLERTFDGSLGFNLANGRINGVNLLAMIKQDYLKYLQRLSINPGELNQTVFSKFAATATVSNGLVDTKDLALNSAQLDVKGRGTVNLASQQLDLHLDALPAGEFAKQLQQYSTTAIPIKVEGTITQPRFSVELDQVLKEKAKQRLNQEKQKLEQQLKGKTQQQRDKLEQQLQDKLKGLFK